MGKVSLRVSVAALCAWALCGGGVRAEDELIELATIASSSLPLSVEWSRQSNFSDSNARQLATELAAPAPLEVNAWSERSESELHSAITADDLLGRSPWSAVRCLRNGCIVAIEVSDPGLLAAPLMTDIACPQNDCSRTALQVSPYIHGRVTLLKGRLLAYLTPRLSPTRHADFTGYQRLQPRANAGAHAQNRDFITFFLFPADTSVVSAGTQPHAISASIRDSMKLAQSAFDSRQWAEAIHYLRAAQAVPALSAFDQKIISEYEGRAYTQLKDYPGAQSAYERGMPFTLTLSLPDAWLDSSAIQALAFLNKKYLTAIEVGRGLIEHGAGTPTIAATISSSYMALSDCRYAVEWADESLRLAAQSAAAPNDVPTNIKHECEKRRAAATGQAEYMLKP